MKTSSYKLLGKSKQNEFQKLKIKVKIIIKNWDILLLFGFLLALFLIVESSIPLPSIVCAQDLGVFFDAGWRFYQGQLCHADYRSPLGPLFSILFGVPMKLFGPEYSSLKFLPFSVTAIISLWAFVLARASIPKLLALLCSLTIGLFAGGLFHPGFQYQALTFAVFYNRVAYGLLAIASISALLPRLKLSISKRLILDISLSASICCMTFLKANFAMAGWAFFLMSLFLVKRTHLEWRFLFISGFAFCFLFGYSIGFRFDLMLQDLLFAASARQSSAQELFFYPLRNFTANADYFGVTGFMALIVALLAWQGSITWKLAGIFCVVLWIPILLGFGLTLMQSHGDGRCFPTLVSGALVAVAWIHAKELKNILAQCLLWLSSGFLALMVAAPLLAAYQFLFTLTPEHFPKRFEGTSLAQWYITDFNTLGENFVPIINEGLALVREKVPKNATLQCIDGANNFNFGTGRRSPKNSALFWSEQTTYSLKAHPSMALFNDTEYLLFPTGKPIWPQPVWLEIYGDYVRQHYEEFARSANYLLLRRKSS